MRPCDLASMILVIMFVHALAFSVQTAVVEAFSLMGRRHPCSVRQQQGTFFTVSRQSLSTCRLEIASTHQDQHELKRNDTQSNSAAVDFYKYVASLKHQPRPQTARSLLYYLKQQSASLHQHQGATEGKKALHMDAHPLADTACSLQPALDHALVLAVRAVKTDYKLVTQLVEAAVQYAQMNRIQLDPRIIGEAIHMLRQTPVSVSKLKLVWRQLHYDDHMKSVWSRSHGPYELNAMLYALCCKNKVGVALQLYYQELEGSDSYSATILLNALTESIQHKSSQSNETLVSRNTPLQADLNSRNNQSDMVASQHVVAKQYTLQNMELHAMQLSDKNMWQWNEALRILDVLLSNRSELVNNPVLSAFLSCSATTSLRWRDKTLVPSKDNTGSAAAAMFVWKLSKQQYKLDEQTCTLILSQLNWRNAVQLLNEMRLQQQPEKKNAMLPRPNLFVYSAAMATCARQGQLATVMELLQHLEKDGLHPNVYVFNNVLNAIDKDIKQLAMSTRNRHRKIRARAQDRLRVALRLYTDHMGNDVSTISPDTVTFHTLLSTIGHVSVFNRHDESWWQRVQDEFPQLFQTVSCDSLQESLVFGLLGRMENTQGCTVSDQTYRHVVRGLSSKQSIFTALERAEKQGFQVTIGVFNAALQALANQGDIGGTQALLDRLMFAGLSLSPDSVLHLFRALQKGGQSKAIPTLLLELDGVEEVNEEHVLKCGRYRLGEIPSSIYSAAITSCLRSNDFESGRRVLSIMKEKGMAPPKESFEDFARSYAVAALQKSQPKDAIGARAKNAFTILSTLEHPTLSSMMIVGKACAAASLFVEAHELLRQCHELVLDSEESTIRGMIPAEAAIPILVSNHHLFLMKACADYGNITFGLRFCDEIQKFARHMSWSESNSTVNGHRLPGNPLSMPITIGMMSREWKYLLMAAAKSGHWRVCLSALQFLKPYIEATNPQNANYSSNRLLFESQYHRMTPALNNAVKCLSIRSQYGWVLRVLEDWMQWSGRLPPRDALLSAFRVLSSRGRGREVNNLLNRCNSLHTPGAATHDVKYMSSVFAAAITSLYRGGLYDDADEAFVMAVSKGALPLNVETQEFSGELCTLLDLHGMNVAIAHSAVRIALQREIAGSNLTSEGGSWESDVVIVTGRGRNSEVRLRPVLRPEVQRMLMEEFYPPLSTTSVPGNMGALRIPADDISAWLQHQRTQKGVRMLTLAALLKNLSSADRILIALSKVKSGRSELP